MMIQMKMANQKRKGFTLIELAIVLAVASLLFAGLWRLMASGNAQLRDQSAAEQHRQLIDAVSSFLATEEGQTWLTAKAANSKTQLTLPAINTSVITCKAAIADSNKKVLCEYLPLGFTNATTNSYGQTYTIRVLKDDQAAGSAPKTYSFMVASLGGDTIPDTSGGRIASMIGNDGGFVYSTLVCGASVNQACGAFGAWDLLPSTVYGYAVTGGHIASRTYSGNSGTTGLPWLARTAMDVMKVDVPGGVQKADFNTIQTDIFLGYVPGTTTGVGFYGAGVGTTVDAGGNTVEAFGGSIDRLGYIRSGRSADKGNPPLNVNTPCDASDKYPADVASGAAYTCDYGLQVNGGANVTGLLQANRLFASVFVYNDSSDQRLKENIKPFDNILEKFDQINGYSFVIKSSKEKRYGVLAQEVEKVFPDIVTDIGSGYKGVDYPGLIGPLVAAVKALKAQNDELRSEMKTLQENINMLKSTTMKDKGM